MPALSGLRQAYVACGFPKPQVTKGQIGSDSVAFSLQNTLALAEEFTYSCGSPITAAFPAISNNRMNEASGMTANFRHRKADVAQGFSGQTELAITSRFRKFGPPALLMLLSLIAMYPLWIGNAYSMVGTLMRDVYPWAALPAIGVAQAVNFYQTDEAELFYPISVSETHTVRAGRIPLWDPFTFAGTPNLHAAVEPTNPLRYVLYFVASPIWQSQIWLWLNILLAMLGAYALLRVLRVGAAGAAFGGITWGLSGAMAFWAIFANVPSAMALVPWIALFLYRSFTTLRPIYAAAAGLAWGMLFQTGHLQPVYDWSMTLGLFAACLMLQVLLAPIRGLPLAASSRALRIASQGAILSIIMLLIGAPVWLRLISWWPYLARAPEPIAMQLAAAIQPRAFVRALLLPNNPWWHFAGGPHYELQAYVGVLPLVLAPFALVTRRRIAFFAVLTAIGAAVLAIGVTPAVATARWLPMFKSIHIANILYIWALGFAVLGALGLDWWVRRLAGRASFSLNALARIVPAGAICLQAACLLLVFWKVNPTQPAVAADLDPSTPVLKAAQRFQGTYHVMPIKAVPTATVWRDPVLSGRMPDIFRLHAVNGYESLMPSYIYRVWGSVDSGKPLATGRHSQAVYINYFDTGLNLDLLKRLSVGILLAAPDAQPYDAQGHNLLTSGVLARLYSGPDGSVFAIHGALPRVFVVPTAVKVNKQTAFHDLMQGGFDAAHEILISGAEAPASVQPSEASLMDFHGSARILHQTVNGMQVAVSSSAAGFLQINDSWAPGWRAWIDGRSAKVYRSNYAFRAVAVPAGRHLVSLRYEPWSFRVGVPAEVAGFLIAGLIAVAFRKQSPGGVPG